MADVLVVNKADRDGAEATVRDLRHAQSLGGRHTAPGAWRPPIVATVAARGEGVDRVLAEVEAIALAGLRERIAEVRGSAALAALAGEVVAGRTDPYDAADRLLASL